MISVLGSREELPNTFNCYAEPNSHQASKAAAVGNGSDDNMHLQASQIVGSAEFRAGHSPPSEN